MRASVSLIFLLLATLSFCCKIITKVEPTKDWWETAQFYQIYPRSFKDSNGDGIGDLNGITEKLDYLKDLGITAVWLSPIFKSPMVDFGYDISDFYSIQDEYGTMEDFERLTKTAKEKGIKVILDFVPNHSSDENEWFTKSVKRERGFEDFYVWHSGKPDPENANNRIPPNNWLSAFRGSAWQWNAERKQYYYHKFATKQPDLNYRNPHVVETMKHVMRYWLSKGVDGFRVDAVPTLFEKINPDGTYEDEPISGKTDDPENDQYLIHSLTEDQPETIDMVYQWRKLFDDYQRIHGGDTRVFLAETYSALNIIRQYYGNETMEGSHIPFNFLLITRSNKDSTAKDVDNVISLWLDNMPKYRTPNWVIGNHDQRRIGSRYGKEKIDTMNMLIMILPGVSVTYNGEEIGMLDGEISWEDSRDPAACNSNRDIYESFTRDPERTPFQWDDTENAGFSTASKTWLPVANTYLDINVKKEQSDPKSHLNVYKSLVTLRKRKVLQFGALKHYTIENVLVLERKLNGEKSLVLVANFSGEQTTLKIPYKTTKSLNILIVNDASTKQLGDKVSSDNIVLGPYESLVLEIN